MGDPYRANHKVFPCCNLCQLFILMVNQLFLDKLVNIKHSKVVLIFICKRLCCGGQNCSKLYKHHQFGIHFSQVRDVDHVVEQGVSNKLKDFIEHGPFFALFGYQ